MGAAEQLSQAVGSLTQVASKYTEASGQIQQASNNVISAAEQLKGTWQGAANAAFNTALNQSVEDGVRVITSSNEGGSALSDLAKAIQPQIQAIQHYETLQQLDIVPHGGPAALAHMEQELTSASQASALAWQAIASAASRAASTLESASGMVGVCSTGQGTTPGLTQPPKYTQLELELELPPPGGGGGNTGNGGNNGGNNNNWWQNWWNQMCRENGMNPAQAVSDSWKQKMVTKWIVGYMIGAGNNVFPSILAHQWQWLPFIAGGGASTAAGFALDKLDFPCNAIVQTIIGQSVNIGAYYVSTHWKAISSTFAADNPAVPHPQPGPAPTPPSPQVPTVNSTPTPTVNPTPTPMVTPTPTPMPTS